MVKFPKNTKNLLLKLLLKSFLALSIYAGSSIILNSLTTNFPGKKINYEQAWEIIQSQQQKFYLKNKKINFVPLEGNPIKDNLLMGLTYSSGNQFYILTDRDFIYKRTLLHEIGHVILNTPSSDTISLESILNDINEEDNGNVLDETEYSLSPSEFFCNLYSLIN